MEKTFRATQKFLLMSPRKLRPVTRLVKKMKPAEALEKLPFIQRRAAAAIAKVIKSAIASAKNQGVSETDLIFKEIRISEGPRLKRGIPASRGQWHPIKKRMSHIRVVLTTRKSVSEAVGAIPSPKSETNPKIENSKSEIKKGKNEPES